MADLSDVIQSPLAFIGREALAAVVAFSRPVTDAWTRIRAGVTAVKTVADLIGTNLLGANLHRAYLREANLHEADLYEADLSEAQLIRVALRKANLSGANLSEVDLTSADLRARLRRRSIPTIDVWRNAPPVFAEHAVDGTPRHA